ncbi:MAG TPA: ABC transporter ATP-binding protein [Solirubrobacteraceae bacterium]
MSSSSVLPGEIILRDATRSFSIRADQARTFKGLLLGARAEGPPPVPALRRVTLHISPGETVGMVGRNGAGKTSTLRVLAGIVPLQSGEALSGGRMVSLLELGSGFSRDFSGRENIYLQGALYGFTKAQIDERIERIVAFSELDHFIEVPVKTYSAGMFLRLGFSIAAFLDADVLLIDEILAVGDEAFQRKCLRRISEQIAGGTTVVLVSHDARAIERVCGRVVVLDGGRIVFDGPTAEGLLHYHRLMGTEHGGGESVRSTAAREIEVTDVELRDGAGRASTVFRTGAAMQIAVVLRTRSAVARPELALEIRSGNGSRAFSTSTEIQATPDGITRLVFEIPSLALLGGDYDVSLAAGEKGVDAAVDRTVGFSVATEPGAEGIVDLRGAWRVLEPAQVAQ